MRQFVRVYNDGKVIHAVRDLPMTYCGRWVPETDVHIHHVNGDLPTTCKVCERLLLGKASTVTDKEHGDSMKLIKDFKGIPNPYI